MLILENSMGDRKFWFHAKIGFRWFDVGLSRHHGDLAFEIPETSAVLLKAFGPVKFESTKNQVLDAQTNFFDNEDADFDEKMEYEDAVREAYGVLMAAGWIRGHYLSSSKSLVLEYTGADKRFSRARDCADYFGDLNHLELDHWAEDGEDTNVSLDQTEIERWLKSGRLDESAKLDVPTPTVAELVKKYRVSQAKVLKQLLKGVEVESEHTTDEAMAREIALDHLGERLDYYEVLEKAEKAPPEPV